MIDPMATVAVFPSVLGVRPGVEDAARRLREAGHDVRVVDPLDGRTFDEYEPAMEHSEAMGMSELMRRTDQGVADLPDGFCCLGFSNGGGMAVHATLTRPVSAVVLCAGSISVRWFGKEPWPAQTALQQHDSAFDPFRDEGVEELAADVRAVGAELESFEYPGTGHLLTDPSLPDEHDPEATELLWTRALGFLSDR